MRNKLLNILSSTTLGMILLTLMVSGSISNNAVKAQSDKNEQGIAILSYEGLVSAPYDFIVRGGRYTSTISIGALKTSLQPTIYLTYDYPFYDSIVEEGEVKYQLLENCEYQTVELDKNGKGIHRQDCYGLGDFRYGGLIYYSLENEDIWIPFSSQYTIGYSSFEINSIVDNILFRGIDNFVAKEAIGYNVDDMFLSISEGGTILPAENGKYNVHIPKTNELKKINITSTIISSQGRKTLGDTEFQIFNVPHPTIMIAGENCDGSILKKDSLIERPYLSTNSSYDFLLVSGDDFEIVSYSFIYTKNGDIVKRSVLGSQFSFQILEDIRSMAQGTLITITDVYYNGPSGEFKTNGLSIIVQ